MNIDSPVTDRAKPSPVLALPPVLDQKQKGFSRSPFAPVKGGFFFISRIEKGVNMKVLRLDRTAINDGVKIVKRDNGYLHVTAPVTRCGVFVYKMPDGTTRRELRHPDEVFKKDSLDTLGNVPLTNEHPACRTLTAKNAKAYTVGFADSQVTHDDSLVNVGLTVIDSASVEDIETNRKREISCGYMCEVIKADGVYNGETYDHKQVGIEYNHIALVKAGRAGSAVRIHMDAQDAASFDIDEEEKTDSKENKDSSTKNKGVSMKTVVIDSVTYEVPEQVAVYLSKIDSATEAGKAELAAMKALADKANAERDSFKSKLDEAEKIDIGAKVSEGVKARLTLINDAAKVLSKEVIAKVDSMTDAEIKIAIIATQDAKFDAAGKSADYIQARVDSIVDFAGKNPDKSGIESQRRAAHGDSKEKEKETHDDNEDPAAAYNARLRDGWKAKK